MFIEKYNQYKQKYLICEGTLNKLLSAYQDYRLRKWYNLGELSSPNYKQLTDEEKQDFDEDTQHLVKIITKTMNKITTNQQYISWIYDLLINGNIELEYFTTNFYITVKECLDKFVVLCRSPKITSEEKNIQNYNSFNQLDNFVNNHVDLLTKYVRINFKQVYSNNTFDVYEIDKKDKQLFQQLYGKTGYDCGWCTVNSDHNTKDFFNTYLEDYGDPYYLWTYKGSNKPFALLHFNSHQFKDIHNSDIPSTKEQNAENDVVDVFVNYFNKNL